MKKSDESVFATWLFIFFLVGLFLIYSLLAFKFIGDKCQPYWDYGVIEDVPAASPYAIYEKLPHPQHVKGSQGE